MEFNFNPAKEEKNPLKEFGRNITEEAINNNLTPVIGRDDEIRRIIRILSRKTKNNPVLVGEPGVGKTAIVEGLAQKIIQGEVPESLKDKEIYEIDLPAMLAGASFQGQFEKRLKSLMKKIKESNGQIIVFIDEIHMLVGTGRNAQGGMDAAQIIKPMLARGEMHLIGATTLDEHRKFIEPDAALERRMQKIVINEPTVEDTITILRGIKEKFETYHGVKIHDNALVAASKLSSRYIFDRFLPDKAIDLMDEAAAAIQTEMNSIPEELEKANQLFARLEMEKAALSSEKDSKSLARLVEIKKELKKAEEKKNAIGKEWRNEKDLVINISKIKENIDIAKNKQSRFQAEGNYEKASIILYKVLPELNGELDIAEKKFKDKKSSLIKEEVTADEIADIVSKWTGIPVRKLLETQKSKLLNLEVELSKSIKGQPEALKKVSDAILRSKANINDPDRPIGSFIFMGPTGVGKTEVARVLAKLLFDSEKHLIRIDMSEYMEKHSVSRLIGSPPGYVGFDQGGQLTNIVRRQPYSIVLFDEIEKAHHEVLNILLQILDDGYITDARGKKVNFKNTIIIMTTNIGSVELMKGMAVKDVVNELHKYLRPEFLNRIDEIIPFNILGKNTIKEIVKLELKKLITRIEERGIRIKFDQSVISSVAKNAYDPIYGARPIKRYIKNYIESPLAKAIISGKIKEGISYVSSMISDKIVYTIEKLN